MNQRFETFVTAITQIYRSVHKLKSEEMAKFGLKGTHVMCLYQLQQHPEGLTAVQLAQVCEEDKAAISRTVSELRELGLAAHAESDSRRYRVPLVLTDKGREITDRMNQRIINAVMSNGFGYTVEDRETFYRVLLRVADNLQEACAEIEKEKSHREETL